jgi:hypothetical protein
MWPDQPLGVDFIRILFDPDHPGEHQCWCQRRFG